MKQELSSSYRSDIEVDIADKGERSVMYWKVMCGIYIVSGVFLEILYYMGYVGGIYLAISPYLVINKPTRIFISVQQKCQQILFHGEVKTDCL